MDKTALGAFIAETRRSAGLTQRALAAQLHVTDKAVSKWERGLSYPDVTLLQPLAAALGLGVEELVACRTAAGGREEETVQQILDISGDSVRREKKRRTRWVAALLLALGVMGAALAAVYAGRFVTQTRKDTVVLKELAGETAYLYVQERGHLLRLACGAEVGYYDVEVGDQIYQLECRWNKETYQGTVSRLTPLDLHPIDERDGIDNIVPLDFHMETQDALFGAAEVTVETVDVLTDPYGEGTFYTYGFWRKTAAGEDGVALLLVEVPNCLGYLNEDYDNDGVTELIVRTRWPEKPYTIYDCDPLNGEITESWPDTVAPRLAGALATPWEQQLEGRT